MAKNKNTIISLTINLAVAWPQLTENTVYLACLNNPKFKPFLNRSTSNNICWEEHTTMAGTNI